MPGHGGILDRVDGVIFAAPIYYALVNFSVLISTEFSGSRVSVGVKFATAHQSSSHSMAGVKDLLTLRRAAKNHWLPKAGTYNKPMTAIITFLQSSVAYIVPMIVLLGLLIFFHELGHFLVAKYFKFALKSSRSVLDKDFEVQKSDTVYAISALPLVAT